MTNTIPGIIRSVPRGFRFHPTDNELLVHYLKPKILGQPNDMIPEIDARIFEPSELHREFCRKFDNEELFFFCQLKSKYASGSRNDRRAKGGYWKQTGEGYAIMSEDNVLIGKRNKLVFYQNHKPRAKRTGWVMHEYHLEPKYLGNHDKNKTRPYVICRIKNNEKKKSASVNQEGDYSSFCDNQHDEVVAAHPEMPLGESTDPLQRQDGILSSHNTIPAIQSQAGAQEDWFDLDFLNDNDGNVFNLGPIRSPLSDPESLPNLPCSPSPGSYHIFPSPPSF